MIYIYKLFLKLHNNPIIWAAPVSFTVRSGYKAAGTIFQLEIHSSLGAVIFPLQKHF